MVQPRVSVIIVHYKAQVELERCLLSIAEHEDCNNLEIIICNNDHSVAVSSISLPSKLFIQVIHQPTNLGFGAACNIAARRATGEYLFFLNPDTELKNNAISRSVEFLQQHIDYGVVAPALFDEVGQLYPEQGSHRYTFWSFITNESVLKKLMNSIHIRLDHFLAPASNEEVKAADVVPGTAFAIRAQVFRQLGGFDQQFFLYYEDLDLCHRVQKLGLRLAIINTAHIMHHWGVAARRENKAMMFFLQSRKKYAQKYFGWLRGLVAYYLVTLHWSIWFICILVVLLMLSINIFSQ